MKKIILFVENEKTPHGRRLWLRDLEQRRHGPFVHYGQLLNFTKRKGIVVLRQPPNLKLRRDGSPA